MKNQSAHWSKINLGGVPGGSLEALGGQYRKMRRAIRFLGPSWGHLGGLLGRLGGLLGPSWRSWRLLGLVLASEIGPQVDQISTPKSIRTLMPLGIDFLEDFGGFGELKWRQVGSKIGAKIDLNSKGRKSLAG